MAIWSSQQSQSTANQYSKVTQDIFKVIYPEMLQASLDTCFSSCNHTFGASELSPGEVNCIKNCTRKWLNVRETVMDQLSKN